MALLLSCLLFVGCASVIEAPKDEDQKAKQFKEPTDGTANIYIYRNLFLGNALKKSIYLDGKRLGETNYCSFFVKNTNAGTHVLSTESEFSENHLVVELKPNSNNFYEQYIKMGVFAGGADLKNVPFNVARSKILECPLGKDRSAENFTIKLPTEFNEILVNAQNELKGQATTTDNQTAETAPQAEVKADDTTASTDNATKATK